MFLRNYERYLEVLDLDLDGRSQRRVLLPGDDIKTNGFFFDHDGKMFGLGVSHDVTLVLLHNQLVRYHAGFQTQINADGEHRVFTATCDGEQLISVSYLPAKPFWNFFFMEDEDVDGFLLIHNVLSSAERRAILVKHNGG